MNSGLARNYEIEYKSQSLFSWIHISHNAYNNVIFADGETVSILVFLDPYFSYLKTVVDKATYIEVSILVFLDPYFSSGPRPWSNRPPSPGLNPCFPGSIFLMLEFRGYKQSDCLVSILVFLDPYFSWRKRWKRIIGQRNVSILVFLDPYFSLSQ